MDAGLAALRSDRALAALARSHSEAMAAGRVAFGHAGIERRLAAACALFGARRGAENVAQPALGAEVATAAVARWVASGQHRRNMLGRYSVTGVGVARAPDGRTFVTAIFVE